jgi:hypothetical protein
VLSGLAALAPAAAAQSFSVSIISDHLPGPPGVPFDVLNPGGPTPIPINSTETFSFGPIFGIGGADHFLTFDVVATNTGGSAFDLALTNLEYRTPVPTPGFGQLPDGEFLRINIWADFVASNGTYAASHDIAGDFLFQSGQEAFVEKCGLHQATPLFCIGTGRVNASGPFTVAPATGSPVVGGGVYSMFSESSFGIYAGTSGYGSIVLPSSAHDSAVLIPAPLSVSTFALAALASVFGARRRQP